MTRLLSALLFIVTISVASALDDISTRVKNQRELFAALEADESADLALARLAAYWNDPSCPQESAIIEITRAAQSLLLFGKGQLAFDLLAEFEQGHPTAKSSPVFCYQSFFTALYGTGNREVAREILDRLNREVQENRLSSEAPEYIAVIAGWYRALIFSDSDLPRQYHLNTQARLSNAQR